MTTEKYTPKWPLSNGHVNTILPQYLERISRIHPLVKSTRLLLETGDGDQLALNAFDLPGSTHTVIVSHGLEGSAKSNYVSTSTSHLLNEGFSVLTWDMRGCGDSSSNLHTWYHSGYTADLYRVIDFTLGRIGANDTISLLGFSVGGNITLKLLGEAGDKISQRVLSACCLSVPIDLEGSAYTLAKSSNRFYMRYLLSPLKVRIAGKAARYPALFDISGLDRISTFHDFDSRYTAPIHGFNSVTDYWRTQSSKPFLSNLRVPTLLLNALDDPFLSESCFASSDDIGNAHLICENVKFGGHVGFLSSPCRLNRWSDLRVCSFIKQHYSPSK